MNPTATDRTNALTKLTALANELGLLIVSQDSGMFGRVSIKVCKPDNGAGFWLHYYFPCYQHKVETITTGTSFPTSPDRTYVSQSELKYGRDINESNKHLHEFNFEIKMNASRPIEALAKDIKRRFFYDYIEAWLLFKNRADDARAYRDSIENRVRSLKDSIVGFKNMQARLMDSGFSVYNKSFNAEVQVSGTVRLTLDGLSDTLATEVLQLLRNAAV